MLAVTDARDPDFYLAQASYVRALARRLVYDRHAADDLFQAAWLAALQRPARDGSSPRQWLAAIVRNLASKAWLAAHRRRVREQRWQEPPPSSSPDDVVAHEHERRRVVEALLELDEPYRGTLIARFFDGLEPAAMAARFDVPVETVRTRIKRGLQRLRERLLDGGASAFAFVDGLRLGEPDLGALVARFGRGVLYVQASKHVLAVVGVVLAVACGWWVMREPEPQRGASAPASTAVTPVAAAANAATPLSAPTPPEHASERTAMPAAAPTGSLAVAVSWADRRPARDVGVRVGSIATANFEVGVVAGRTDRDGRVRFDGLAAGEAFVESDRGAARTCAIRAGACTEITLTIERGVRIRGRVVDVDGRAAAGAAVHMLSRPVALSGSIVAYADADGVFAIEDAPAERALGLSACMPQRAPTPQQVVTGAAGGLVDVELRFRARGGAVTGRVVDDRGEPVARAVVLVGPDTGFESLRTARSSGESPPLQAWRASTDEHGEWLIDGIAAGETPVLVVAPGRAPWDGQVRIVEHGLVRCDAVLAAGVRLDGSVRDDKGAPMPLVEVRVGRWGLRSAFTRTAADGSFSLDGLPLGDFAAIAKADGAGEARAEFVGVAGGTLRWDPVLERATTLRGRVLAAGAPVPRAQVMARCMASAQREWFANTTADADGAFVITNCPDALLHLDVRTPSSGFFVVALRDDVDPRAGEVLLEVDPAREPSAFVVGRVVDPDGRPVGGADVTILPTSMDIGGGHAVRTGDDGRFATPGCPPGEWYAYANAEGWARVGSPRHTLPAGATVDLGDLVLARGHAVVVTLHPEPGVDLTGLVVGIADTDCGITNGEPEGGVVRLNNVGPGDYVLTAYAPGVALRPVLLHVGAEAETAFVLPLAAGSEVTVDLRDAQDRPVVDRLETGLYDGKGVCIDRTPLTPGAGPMQWARRLVADHYTLHLRDHRGRTTVVPVTVPPGGRPVRTTARL